MVSLSFASHRVRDMFEPVLSAVRQNRHALWFSSSRLQQDTDILHAIDEKRVVETDNYDENAYGDINIRKSNITKKENEASHKCYREVMAKRRRTEDSSSIVTATAESSNNTNGSNSRKKSKTPVNSPNNDWLRVFR